MTEKIDIIVLISPSMTQAFECNFNNLEDRVG